MCSHFVHSQLLDKCRELELDLAGIVDASASVSYNRFQQWLDNNMHAGMSYLEKHRDARKIPKSLLADVKSLLVVGLSRQKTQTDDLAPTVSGCRIARYAWGIDYHLVLWEKLKTVAAFHKQLLPNEKTRCVVDTAPILEREYAFRAGLGWFGKNTMLINEKLGSDFFIGILLSTATLEVSETKPDMEFSLCGDCRKCLDCCPTGALVAPYLLDARKCINYWSIEHRGDIPQVISRKMGNRLFGCDLCQSVCPFQAQQEKPVCQACQPYELFRPEQEKKELEQSSGVTVSPEDLENMDESGFEQMFGRTALYRTGLDGLKRNLAITQLNREPS